MKQKDFIFNVILLIFLNLLIKPFWILGIDVGVQNRVGAENYGLYFAVFNFTFLFNMLLDMGITNSTTGILPVISNCCTSICLELLR